MTIKISIDCMGGDHGPSVTVPAAISFLRHEPDAELILVGQEEALLAALKKHKLANHPRISIQAASEVVTMDDSVEVALRRKKDSSMRVAINMVKDGRAQAAVSAGNTGALMAVSRYVLKTIPGVDRPAICTILPNQKDGPTYMLDLGANVDCEPQHLHQFALMGSALVSAMEGKPKPTVGLLNVGEEEIKGNDLVKHTAELLHADHEKGILNFYGNVEGNHQNALKQLQKMRGRRVVFHTALCLWDSRNNHASAAQLVNIQTFVTFRDLSDAELDAYLRIEQPYDCAGSAKNEGLGITILERIDSSDPTALTGLPLIALSDMLRRAGVPFFAN